MGCVYLYQGQQFKTKEALVSFLNSASLQNNSTTQGQTSTLFERLMNQYGRKKAKELYEYLFSDEFVNEYGDWTIGESTLELNEQGEPETFYYPSRFASPNELEGMSLFDDDGNLVDENENIIPKSDTLVLTSEEGDALQMLKSQFGIDAKIDKTFGNIPSVSFSSKKVVSESINEDKVYIDFLNKY